MSRKFHGSVYRDDFFLAVAETSNSSAIAPTGFIVTSTGLPTDAIRMDSGDGIQVLVLGTDAADETVEVLVCGLNEQLDPDGNMIGWMEYPLCHATVTLGTTTAGADLAAAIEGIESTDLIGNEVALTADQYLADTLTCNSQTAGGTYTHIIPAEGAKYVTIKLKMGTAASALALARRTQGKAQK